MGGSTLFSLFSYFNAVFLSKTVKQMTLYTTSVLCLDYVLNLPLVFPNRNKTVQCPLENRGRYAGLALWQQLGMWKYGRKGRKAKEVGFLQFSIRREMC